MTLAMPSDEQDPLITVQLHAHRAIDGVSAQIPRAPQAFLSHRATLQKMLLRIRRLAATGRWPQRSLRVHPTRAVRTDGDSRIIDLIQSRGIARTNLGGFHHLL